VRQSQLLGVLYLENGLLSHAFTPARVEISRILALQAAGALENARLYAELQRENAERKRSQEALHAAQSELARVTRATTLGELAASIAHEVNQPLAAIVAEAFACMNWLKAEQVPVSQIRQALLGIIDDGERAGQVLRRIRALLSRTEIARSACQLTETIESVLLIAGPELARHTVAWSTQLAADLPPVMGDSVELQQVLLNLILNAAEASRELPLARRRIAVHAFAEQRDGRRWARVEVEDAGVGVEDAQLSQLFTAFYTTKPGGLGMGLSISRSIIQRHGGELFTRKNPVHGVTFGFSLPAAFPRLVPHPVPA
jgi:C4-dicarboxylate-specific signal transduction histidine kinase